MHKLLILGSLLEFTSLVEKAKAMGYYTVVCDGYKDGPAKAVADKSYDIDVRDVESIVAMCKSENIDGIITSFSDLLFEQATKIAEAASLKWYISSDMLPYYRDKYVAKTLLRELGISVAKTFLIDKKNSDSIVQELTFPIVIKPLSGYGSHGIVVINDKFEFSNYIQTISQDQFPLYAEEYIYGDEYNMQTWVHDGEIKIISIADREKNLQVGNKIPLISRVVYPAKKIDDVKQKALDILKKFINSTGQTSGPLSMQFFNVDGTIYVCEIAGRFFGYEHKAIEFCSNLDLEKLLLLYPYEQDKIPHEFLNYSPDFPKYCSVMYLIGKYGEKIGDLSNIVELLSDQRIPYYDVPYSSGMITKNSGDLAHLAYLYLVSSTRDDLDSLNAKIFKNFKVYNDRGENIACTYVLGTKI